MIGPANEYAAAVEIAARWLATTRRDQISGHVVPLLRQRFGLSLQESCAAIAQANLRRARAA